jgi:hypothetical protein
MAVTTHVDRGVVVVSHWQGAACVSTFRLPIVEAARLIAAIAEGMASSLPNAPTPTPTLRVAGWRARLTSLLARIGPKSSLSPSTSLRLIEGRTRRRG